MNALGIEEIRGLAEQGKGPCVSIFMPIHSAGVESQQNPIRLKNLLREAAGQLESAGKRSPDVREFLQPLANLVEDRLFWRRQGDGLALFLNPQKLWSYRMGKDCPEICVVGPRFLVKPLVAALHEEASFLLLALSRNHVQLYRGDRLGLVELEVPGMPKDMEDALGYETREPASQVHSGAQPVMGRAGKKAAVFHGQGGEADVRKEELERFCYLLDGVLHGVLQSERLPLWVACVEYVFPIFKQANSYPYLVDSPLAGNPDHLRPDELHDFAWSAVLARESNLRDHALEQLEKLTGTPRTAFDLCEILLATRSGRVETLFVDPGVSVKGTFPPDGNGIEIHTSSQPGDEDLINLAIRETLSHSGGVQAVQASQLGGVSPVAAVYRY